MLKRLAKAPRTARSFILICAMTLGIAGCSSGNGTNTNMKSNGNAPKTETTAETGTEKEAAPAAAGGTLKIARLSDATSLDPHYITNIASASVIHRTVYEMLVQRDKNMEFQPMLAKEWKQLDDLTWEFKLRDDVKFHDGTPFNAVAVKATIARALESPRAVVFKMVQEIKAVDDHTLQIVLKTPFSPLLSVLASHESSIMSPKAMETYGKELSLHPTGTGPFKFESWTPGEEVVLAKHEGYWGEPVKLDKVVYMVVPEDTTRLAMVETGEADIADGIPVTEMARVEGAGVVDLYKSEAFGAEFIGFNVKKKPFDNMKVRQAISHAIQREDIFQGVYNGAGKLANSTMGSKVFGYSDKLQPYPYDVTKAKALLAEAGFPNGFKAEYWTNDRKERIALAEVVQSQLKEIGVELEVKVMEYGAYLESTAKGEQQMFMTGWGNATGDADYNQSNMFLTESHGTTGNVTFYSNPEVDALIQEGRKETDPEKRKEIYHKAQEIELTEAAIIPIRNLQNNAAISKKVKGFWINPSGYLMVNEASVE
ncbi:ABC transporter substrate-binding protein [Paenibacillus swuensis]|uniref:ABC transporter substrate-binding protein n=1 Tax=Paenibacillus swuensis TaxID=1178515 RepID=A0A172TE18_9BACL|nr:glutathione ABC transporter substrate-binding protein [Paenibacillus swuensis]ANE45192.1 ABC transporter substrate-binding protein [Paenibacillus swuensis]